MAEEEKDVVVPLDLSDEELANFDMDAYLASEETDDNDDSTDSDTDVDTDVNDDKDPDKDGEAGDDKDLDTDDDSEPDDNDQNDPDKEPKSKEVISKELSKDDPDLDTDKKDLDAESKDVGDKPKSVDSAKEVDTKDTKEKDPVELDYEKEYNKVFAPFKANGKMMQVENAEDVRTLMQMGANYNKKMAGLKPSLKIVKMLENNNLMSEEKISFLIDLDKQNPDAIKKLISDAKLDVLEIDPAAKQEYQPNNTYTVNDKEVELDGVLDQIKDTEAYSTTLDIISTKWDLQSRNTIYQNPHMIKTINDHVASGVFDQITAVMEREKILGRLSGITDFDAYKQVGDALDKAGKFKDQSNGEQKPDVSKAIKKDEDPKIKDKKRAASSTKTTQVKGKKPAFNPLDLSDEDFDKVSLDKYIS